MIRLPSVSSDTCTELVMRNHASLAKIEKQMRSLSESTASLSSKISVIDTQLSSLPSGSSTLTPSDTLVTYAQVAQSTHAPFSASNPTKNKFDRRENPVIFGVDESGSVQDTMDRVRRILSFLIPDAPPVKDLFRLGRRKNSNPDSSTSKQISRPRPLILKLMSPWDRRLVLSNKYRLKEYEVKGIFIREDLSPEERAKRKLQRQSGSGPNSGSSST